MSRRRGKCISDQFSRAAWLLLTFLLLGSLVAFVGSVYALDPDTDLSNADASFWGEDGSDQSGYSVASAGDVNGDGLDDFLIGAPGDDDGGFMAGQTYLLLGTPPTVTVVGGEVYSININEVGSKAGVSALWVGLGLASVLAVGGGVLILRRRRAH